MENDHPHDPHGVPPGPAAPRRSNLPLDELSWKRAHADYVAGCSCAVVAERYGVNERTVRRRAAREGWRHERPEHLQRLRPLPCAAPEVQRMVARAAGDPPTAEEATAEDPELAIFVAAHTHEIGQLLLRPAPQRLSRFAFRRAAEAAAQNRPSEAAVWMRLVQSVARTREHMERSARPLADADYVRATYAARLRSVTAGSDMDPEDDEPSDAPLYWTPEGRPLQRDGSDRAPEGGESGRPDAR